MGPVTHVIVVGAVPLACSEKPQGHPAAAARTSGVEQATLTLLWHT